MDAGVARCLDRVFEDLVERDLDSCRVNDGWIGGQSIAAAEGSRQKQNLARRVCVLRLGAIAQLRNENYFLDLVSRRHLVDVNVQLLGVFFAH